MQPGNHISLQKNKHLWSHGLYINLDRCFSYKFRFLRLCCCPPLPLCLSSLLRGCWNDAVRWYLVAEGGTSVPLSAAASKGQGLDQAPCSVEGPCPSWQRRVTAGKTSCRTAIPGVPLSSRGSAVNQCTHTYSRKHDRQWSRLGFWWGLVSCCWLLRRVDAARRATCSISVGCLWVYRVGSPCVRADKRRVFSSRRVFFLIYFTEGASHKRHTMKWGSLTMMAMNHVKFIWLFFLLLEFQSDCLKVNVFTAPNTFTNDFKVIHFLFKTTC